VTRIFQLLKQAKTPFAPKFGLTRYSQAGPGPVGFGNANFTDGRIMITDENEVNGPLASYVSKSSHGRGGTYSSHSRGLCRLKLAQDSDRADLGPAHLRGDCAIMIFTQFPGLSSLDGCVHITATLPVA
jgi:hypothetical protein